MGADDKKKDLIVARNQIYAPERVLGAGIQGEVKLYKSTTTNEVIAKKVTFEQEGQSTHRQQENLNDAIMGINIFNKVYNELGSTFLAEFKRIPNDYHISTHPKNKYHFGIIPFVQGEDLISYTNRKNQENRLDDLEIAGNLANFCWNMHNIGVTHNDLTSSNIFIVNDYGGIFLIDYGRAFLVDLHERPPTEWYARVIDDVAGIIFVLFAIRQAYMEKKKWTIDLRIIMKMIRIERWLVDNRLNCFNTDEFIDRVINYCYELQDVHNRHYIPLFDAQSIEDVKQDYKY